MKYRNLGNTGIKVSTLGFSSMRLPSKNINGETIYNVDESLKIIHKAFELGVNYIDTAP